MDMIWGGLGAWRRLRISRRDFFLTGQACAITFRRYKQVAEDVTEQLAEGTLHRLRLALLALGRSGSGYAVIVGIDGVFNLAQSFMRLTLVP